MKNLLLCLDKAVSYSKLNIKHSFWVNVFDLMKSQLYDYWLQILPKEMSNGISFGNSVLYGYGLRMYTNEVLNHTKRL